MNLPSGMRPMKITVTNDLFLYYLKQFRIARKLYLTKLMTGLRPMSKSQIIHKDGGEPIQVPIYDSLGNVIRYDTKIKGYRFDSFYKFRIQS